MPLQEVYRSQSFFVQLGGFASERDLDAFCKYHNIVRNMKQEYPTFCIMRHLQMQYNVATRHRTVTLAQLDELKKQEEIRKLQLYNMQRSGELIKRSSAKERMRLAFQNVASKIRYAIKNTAPRLVGMDSARLIEELLTKAYNGALKLLEEEADNVTWEADDGGGVLPELKPIEAPKEVSDISEEDLSTPPSLNAADDFLNSR